VVSVTDPFGRIHGFLDWGVKFIFHLIGLSVRLYERLCGLVVRVLGYRSGGPCSIPGTTKKK
jgi:hypothetical protein